MDLLVFCSSQNKTKVNFPLTYSYKWQHQGKQSCRWGFRSLGGAVEKRVCSKAEEPLKLIVTYTRPNLPRGHSASLSRSHPSRGAILRPRRSR